jgi:hypothetical protein
MVLALKRPRERSLKEGCGVKKHLAVVVFIVFLFGGVQVSDALIYKFEDTILGVPFQATMDINVSGNQLTINLENTSPIAYGPTIWGFGVGLKNFYEIIGSMKKEFTAGGIDVTNNWTKPGFGDYLFYFSARSDSSDSLYNPGSKQFNPTMNSSTPATFIFTFSGVNPVLDESVMPIIRVGGSAFSGSSAPLITKGNLVATPEPGTLLLLGLGLVGIGLIMREML